MEVLKGVCYPSCLRCSCCPGRLLAPYQSGRDKYANDFPADPAVFVQLLTNVHAYAGVPLCSDDDGSSAASSSDDDVDVLDDEDEEDEAEVRFAITYCSVLPQLCATPAYCYPCSRCMSWYSTFSRLSGWLVHIRHAHCTASLATRVYESGSAVHQVCKNYTVPHLRCWQRLKLVLRASLIDLSTPPRVAGGAGRAGRGPGGGRPGAGARRSRQQQRALGGFGAAAGGAEALPRNAAAAAGRAGGGLAGGGGRAVPAAFGRA